MKHAILPALALLALLPSLALAGAPAPVYGPTGAYQGRVQAQPGQPGLSNVYGPTGAYLGRIQTPPGGGPASVYGPTGQYQGQVQGAEPPNSQQ